MVETLFNHAFRTTITKMDDGTLKYGGYEFMIFDAIASKLRFSYTIGLPTLCCMWGREVDNGKNFTGLLGDMFNGYSDVGWANLFDTPARRKALDVTEAYTIDSGCFMVHTI